MLAAYTTAKDSGNGTGPYLKVQTTVINRGSGTFTIFLPMQYRGWPHVSFYPAEGGGSFGGNYSEQVIRCSSDGGDDSAAMGRYRHAPRRRRSTATTCVDRRPCHNEKPSFATLSKSPEPFRCRYESGPAGRRTVLNAQGRTQPLQEIELHKAAVQIAFEADQVGFHLVDLFAEGWVRADVAGEAQPSGCPSSPTIKTRAA